jgi:hypothetical protein
LQRLRLCAISTLRHSQGVSSDHVLILLFCFQLCENKTVFFRLDTLFFRYFVSLVRFKNQLVKSNDNLKLVFHSWNLQEFRPDMMDLFCFSKEKQKNKIRLVVFITFIVTWNYFPSNPLNRAISLWCVRIAD